MNNLMHTATFIGLSLFVNGFVWSDESPSGSELKRWEFDTDTAGWDQPHQCKLSVVDGALRVVSQGDDPFFSVAISADDGWKELKLRARFTGPCEGQVFWTTKNNPATSENQSARFYMRSDGEEWQTARVYFKPDSELTGIRLDPLHKKGRIDIDWIALTNRQPPAPAATPVEQIKVLPGFKAELLYSVPQETEGSWVCLTVDDRGRLITSDQYGKLYRLTPPAIGAAGPLVVEPIDVKLGMAQGLLYAFDSLYVVVNGDGPGLYRVRDTNGDDKLDEVKLLRKIEGASEHGPHAVILGPDKKSIYVCSGNHTKLPDPEKSRVPRVWDEDHLLGRLWDAGGHAVGIMAPGGWICRTDPEGKEWELIGGGFRNEYDIAFNSEGELFTYDADMEWDVGLPWYRPTRVNHVTSGSEFGWRSGTGKWPAYYPDSLAEVVNIGPGSPTGIAFGYGAKFPVKYQQALFIIDWSYGVIYAVHLTPAGSSFVGTAEPFVFAAPLPGTDLVINPKDGAMYFTIGGRRTQSGLYRVTYVGDESTEPDDRRQADATELRQLRRELEDLHTTHDEPAIDKTWKYLGHDDRHIRFAARIAVEHRPVAMWQERALAETDPRALTNAMLALARHGDKSLQPKMIDRLCGVGWKSLDESQQLDLLRAFGLTFIRLGRPNDAARKASLAYLDPLFPASTEVLNRELCQVLIYLEAPGVVSRTLQLLDNAATQEEQIHYLISLRNLKSDWTPQNRQRYFKSFLTAAVNRGGHSFEGFIANIRQEAIDGLTDPERKALDTVLKIQPTPTDPVDTIPRSFVKKWTVAELLPRLEAGLNGRDFENGRRVFAASQCFKCHRFDGRGGIVGPDLTAVSRRYNSQTLLDSLIEPSKVISDQYQAMQFELEDGRSITGRIVNLSGKSLRVSTNMLDPGNLTSVNTDEITAMQPSRTSQMPDNLLDTFNEQEVLDLIAYLRSGGDRNNEAFKK